MKRKAEKRPEMAPPPPRPVSAIAARRARQQTLKSTEQLVNANESRLQEEHLPKRTRSIPTDTNDDAEIADRSSRASSFPQGQSKFIMGAIRTDKLTEVLGGQLEIGDVSSSELETERVEQVSGMSELAEEDNSNLEGQEDEECPELVPQPLTDSFPLSKIRLGKANIVYSDENTLCVRLKEKMTLVLIGIYDLWVKRGVISLFGSKIHASPSLYRVYAPSTHSLPVIKYVSGMEGYAEVEIRSCHTGIEDLGEMSPLFSRIWNEAASETGHTMTAGTSRRSFSVVYTSSDDPLNRHLRPLHLDKKWSTGMKTLSQRGHRLRVLVCGPKGSGKSTFSKYLLNHLLSPAPATEGGHLFPDGLAFLDLDPGQPEFSPMGSIYLAHLRSPYFGPSFSHPSLYSTKTGQIVHLHNIGSSSPKDDPDHYVAVAMNLMDHYLKLLHTYPRCPLIVNYPGWIFGQGLEVAMWLIQSLSLSDVVYMSEKGPEEVVQPLGYTCAECNIPLTVLPSQPIDLVSRSSAQLRSMQMQSYFHISQPVSCQNPIWNDTPMSRVSPTVVDYAGDQQGILGIMVTGSQHNPSLLRDIIEGALVSVVAIDNIRAFPGLGRHGIHNRLGRQEEISNIEYGNNEEDRDDRGDGNNEEQAIPDTTPEQSSISPPAYGIVRTTLEHLPYILVGPGASVSLDPTASHCIGLAFIRAVNVQQRKLELATPIPPAIIKDAIDNSHSLVLVRGHLDNPNWAISEEYHAARTAEKRHLNWMVEMRKAKQRTAAESKGPKRTTEAEEEDDSGSGDDGLDVDLEDPVEKLDRLKGRIRNASQMSWMTVIDDADRKSPLDRGRRKKSLWKLRKKAYVGTESETDW